MRASLLSLLLAGVLLGTTTVAAVGSAPLPTEWTETVVVSSDGETPRCSGGTVAAAAAVSPGAQSSTTPIPECNQFALLKNPLGHVRYTIVSPTGTLTCDWPPQAASSCSGSWSASASTTVTLEALTDGSVIVGAFFVL